MESIQKSEDIEKENKLLRDVQNILTGRSYYGNVEIKKTQINPDFIWIGTNDHTTSIGQWMRYIWDMINPESSDPHIVVQGFKWYTPVKAGQRQWYFGFKLTHQGEETIVACGGATDYNKDGKHVKQIADYFMELICSGSTFIPIITLDANHLITYLIGGVIIEG